MPIMRFAVLCGSHSGALAPDLHGLVPELEDIEILSTRVSYCDGQPDPSMGSYIPVIKATERSHRRRTRDTLSQNNRASINPNNLQTPI